MSFEAKMAGTCAICTTDILPGDLIVKLKEPVFITVYRKTERFQPFNEMQSVKRPFHYAHEMCAPGGKNG